MKALALILFALMAACAAPRPQKVTTIYRGKDGALLIRTVTLR